MRSPRLVDRVLENLLILSVASICGGGCASPWEKFYTPHPLLKRVKLTATGSVMATGAGMFAAASAGDVAELRVLPAERADPNASRRPPGGWPASRTVG